MTYVHRFTGAPRQTAVYSAKENGVTQLPFEKRKWILENGACEYGRESQEK